MYNKLKFLHRKTQSVFFFKFLMIRLLSLHHPAANPSPPYPLCPAAGQRGRSGEGLAEAQLPHIFQDGVSPFAPAPDRTAQPAPGQLAPGHQTPTLTGRAGVGVTMHYGAKSTNILVEHYINNLSDDAMRKLLSLSAQ